MTIGKKIKSLRKDRVLTQEELAEKIGVSAGSIFNWEKDQNEPTIFNCIVMADFFDVTLDELCCRK
jgi:DNA-binding XRE family transcriptional regulator